MADTPLFITVTPARQEHFETYIGRPDTAWDLFLDGLSHCDPGYGESHNKERCDPRNYQVAYTDVPGLPVALDIGDIKLVSSFNCLAYHQTFHWNGHKAVFANELLHTTITTASCGVLNVCETVDDIQHKIADAKRAASPQFGP